MADNDVQRDSVARPLVSVLMPTFNQAAFIRRSIASLCAQTLQAWELVIVDDGSQDQTATLLEHYLADERIRYYRLEQNVGLGQALNYGLERAHASLIAYLPSDDLYFSNHLASLVACLSADPDAILVYSGVRHEVLIPGTGMVDHSSNGLLAGFPLQLVQVLHRRTTVRWLSRSELVTDDLERMFWSRLRSGGSFLGSNRITCQWIDHPQQRHKLIREPLGGLNPYRSYYHVKEPLRFQASNGDYLDEYEHYQAFLSKPASAQRPDGLKIVLVGELGHHPERILALEERGHKLYGLWSPQVHWCNAVGPLPFGHIEDLPNNDWQEALQRIKPDIIYAQMNWIAVPFVHHIVMHNPGIPLVWHLKEGPFDCIANNTWAQLVDLYVYSDGQIYINQETYVWFTMVLPGIIDPDRTLQLDGELPKRDWFSYERSPRLSSRDGKIHMVVPGGLGNLQSALVAQLARDDVHLHLYGISHINSAQAWVAEVQREVPGHLHLHQHVDQRHWVREFSQYDAGWLHIFESKNEGDPFRINWADLNYPARISTLVAAGVPSVQYDNQKSIVAMQSLARHFNLGIFYKNSEHLLAQLRDEAKMRSLRESVWQQREHFTFDAHADRLLDFFYRIIDRKKRGDLRQRPVS